MLTLFADLPPAPDLPVVPLTHITQVDAQVHSHKKQLPPNVQHAPAQGKECRNSQIRRFLFSSRKRLVWLLLLLSQRFDFRLEPSKPLGAILTSLLERFSF